MSENNEMSGQGPLVMIDGVLCQMEIRGEIAHNRGPIGQMIDLIERLEADGMVVPESIKAAVAAENQPKKE